MRRSQPIGNKDFSIFAKYAKCSPDPFWQTFFEALGRGEFPKGFYYDEALRCINFSSKKERAAVEVELPTTKVDTFRNFHRLQNFFRTKGVHSPADVVVPTTEDSPVATPSASTWAAIKAKSTRKLLIYNFCVGLCVMFNLGIPPDVVAEKVMLMMSFQSIKPADVVIKNGRIVGIKNVFIDEADVTFPKVTKPRKAPPAKKEAPPAILQAIEKLIKDDKARLVRV
jgi:hypothetical protein